MNPPLLLVTRPQPQADEWVAALSAFGVNAAALPLLAIEDGPDPAAVVQAWGGVARHDLVMFVSPNAVERFMAARPVNASSALWPAATLAGSTGPGTAHALLAAGVPAAQIVSPPADPGQFDAEALWAQLQTRRDWAGASALVVRGEGGRDWLAETLRAAGASVGFVAAYRRVLPQWSAAQRAVLAHALARPAEHLWLFSSSQALGHLATLAPGADWSASAALATHARIAASAQRAGFASVQQVAPSLRAVAQAVRPALTPSIQSPAP